MVHFQVPDVNFSPILPFLKESGQIVSVGVFVIFIILCLGLACFKCYTRIRNSIPDKVNCWFCNEDTKVHHLSRDGWNCPNCQQYNGFTKDGGYNKRIPAQFIESLNHPVVGARDGGGGGRQRMLPQLCERCNMNQELKYFQLAQYVPVKEDEYDKEIEDEARRLDQVYDICATCKEVVRRALENNGLNNSPSLQHLGAVDLGSIQRPLRPNTPGRSPQYQHQENKRQENHIADNFSREDSDLFGTKLNQLHIGTSKQRSVFGGSNASSVTIKSSPSFTNFQGPRRFDQKFMSSPSSIKFSPPSSTISGYLGDKRELRLGPGFSPWTKSQSFYPNYSVNDVHQTSAGFHHNYPAYHYRSSSVASVFGGQKPLLSPSRLAGSLSSLNSQQGNPNPIHPAGYRHYNHMCYCQQSGLSSYGAYGVGVIYGSNMTLSPNEFISSPPQYNYMQSCSKSSSMSSGFVSRDPTNGSSGTLTPTSRLSTTPNSGIDDYEPLIGSAFKSSPHTQHRSGQFTSSHMNRPHERNSTPNICQPQHITRSTSPFRLSSYKPKNDRNDDELIFSDDDDNVEAKSSVPTKNINQLRRRKANFSSPQLSVNAKHVNGFISKKNLDNRSLLRRIGNYIAAALSPRRLLQFLVRIFLFINVLLVFCIFFVGKWPDPIQSVVDNGIEFYENCYDYIISPLITNVESLVNIVLSLIIPDDPELDVETAKSVLFD